MKNSKSQFLLNWYLEESIWRSDSEWGIRNFFRWWPNGSQYSGTRVWREIYPFSIEIFPNSQFSRFESVRFLPLSLKGFMKKIRFSGSDVVIKMLWPFYRLLWSIHKTSVLLWNDLRPIFLGLVFVWSKWPVSKTNPQKISLIYLVFCYFFPVQFFIELIKDWYLWRKSILSK